MRGRHVGLVALVCGGCPVSDPGPSVGTAASETPSVEEASAAPAHEAPWSPPSGPMVQRGSLGAYTSVPVRLDVRPPEEPDPAHTQAEVLAGAHVSFSGMVVCEACVGALLLRVVPFQGPESQLGSPPGPLTTVALTAAGPFRLGVPTGTTPVALELLIDTDGDGRPSRGERLAVVVGQGTLLPDQDRGGFVLDGTEPMAGPWSGGGGQRPAGGEGQGGGGS